MFILQNIPVPEPKLGDLDVELIPLHSAAVDTDLTVELLDLPTGMAGSSSTTGTCSTPTRWSDSSATGCGCWPRRPTTTRNPFARSRCSPSPSRTSSSRRRTARPCRFPQRASTQLVSLQAARSPDAVAVRMGDVALTYRDLEERADRLAGHLCRLGVNPGTGSAWRSSGRP